MKAMEMSQLMFFVHDYMTFLEFGDLVDVGFYFGESFRQMKQKQSKEDLLDYYLKDIDSNGGLDLDMADWMV